MAPLALELAHRDVTGLEVDVGVQQQLERHRLRPQLAADAAADLVVAIELVVRDDDLDGQRVGEDARLESEDRLADALLQQQHTASKRRRVHKACVYCHRSHLMCDSERPCTRCKNRKIPYLCRDEEDDLHTMLEKSKEETQAFNKSLRELRAARGLNAPQSFPV